MIDMRISHCLLLIAWRWWINTSRKLTSDDKRYITCVCPWVQPHCATKLTLTWQKPRLAAAPANTTPSEFYNCEVRAQRVAVVTQEEIHTINCILTVAHWKRSEEGKKSSGTLHKSAESMYPYIRIGSCWSQAMVTCPRIQFPTNKISHRPFPSFERAMRPNRRPGRLCST